MLVSYARVSTQDQKPELQFDALLDADLKAARAMLADKSITVEEVVKRLRVSCVSCHG